MCVCEREGKSAAAAAAAAAHSFHGNVGTHLGLYGNFWLAPTEKERERESDEGKTERRGRHGIEGQEKEAGRDKDNKNWERKSWKLARQKKKEFK